MPVEYKPWYQRYAEMFKEECEEMRKRGFTLDQPALARQCVTFTGLSSVEPDLLLTVEYPDSFPSKPPRVFTPQNWRILPRHHRPNTREICTFGTGQRRWTASLWGTAAIDEADRVIHDVLAGAEGEGSGTNEFIDDAPEPITASYFYDWPVFMLVPPDIFRLSQTMQVGDCANLRLRFREGAGSNYRCEVGRGVVTELAFKKSTEHAKDFYQDLAKGETQKGRVYRVASPPPIVKSATQFNEWLDKKGIEKSDWIGFIFSEQTGTANQERLTWILFRIRGKSISQAIRTFVIDEGDSNPRIQGLEGLRSKRVVLIGCGSMGSKIGAALAATGIENFGLVDCDFLEPSNAVRHELGVSYFGFSKVQAIEFRLVDFNPNAWGKIKKLDILIGNTNQQVKDKELYELLSSADLVIESTGDHSVSRFIADLCAELNVPQIYATVTNGAWAGEIVRVVPRQSGCWLCWDDEYRDLQPPKEPEAGPGIFAPGCDNPTFTGATFDIGTVASLAASLAVDTLLMNTPDRKRFDGDYIRWQLRCKNGDFAPKIEILSVTKREVCRLCKNQ